VGNSTLRVTDVQGNDVIYVQAHKFFLLSYSTFQATHYKLILQYHDVKMLESPSPHVAGPEVVLPTCPSDTSFLTLDDAQGFRIESIAVLVRTPYFIFFKQQYIFSDYNYAI
jgi:hypothetical protein